MGKRSDKGSTSAGDLACRPVPGAASAGRKPNVRTVIYRQGVFLTAVGVFPGKRKELPKWSIGPTSAKPKMPDGQKSDEAVEADEPEAPEKIAATPGEEQSLYVKEGGQLRSFKLEPDQVAAFDEFRTRVRGAKGIHLQKIVPGSALARFPHVNTYFLRPEDVWDSFLAYHALHTNLYATSRAILAHYVHGRGFTTVAIVAAREGLVMWQLPPYGGAHRIQEVLTPAPWTERELTSSLRETLERVLGTMSGLDVEETDLLDPVARYLHQLGEQQRGGGQVPECGSHTKFGDLAAALESLLPQ